MQIIRFKRDLITIRNALFFSSFTFYVSNKNEEHIAKLVALIMGTGIKGKDAYHVACTVMAE